ncbi:MAG: 4Fe-4S dicluster domain-containing protein, partial [Propionibacteriaceae bacterium]|jgi:D-lactate dehydrogenase|nr:4Fe-4S dicluster domain-containing protein [Propionibacteriaceae bacterium]
LAQTCVELGEIFDRYGYEDSVIFGHAKDGNIHFMITDDFGPADNMKRYEQFTEDMVDVILNYSGSLKAEHGTGRIMAPFVPRQWGGELFEVMVETKNLFDPKRLLNDNTIVTEDAKLHLKDFKTPVSIVEPGDYALLDRCVSCGYCEPVCPSRDLTMTPRQRIAMRREIELAKLAGDTATAEKLSKQFRYDGRDTCAVCGLCSTVCPLTINTALLVKKYRKSEHPALGGAVWSFAAKHWGGTVNVASAAMSVAHALPGPLKSAVIGINKAGRAILGDDNLQLISKELPGGGRSRKGEDPGGDVAAVYVPACVNTMFGPAKGEGVQAAFEELLKLAGIKVRIPEGINSMCCGTVWSSKQIPQGYEAMRKVVLPKIKAASENGRLPVICDASSCTEGYAHIIATDDTLDIEVIDAVAFVAEHVLPKLGSYPKLPSLTLHETCSSTQMGLNPAFETVAAAVADKVNVPIANGCCAFAGDRGMLHPELTRAATRPEAAEVAKLNASAHASVNRTCELGLTRATGKIYQHVLELLVQQVKLG